MKKLRQLLNPNTTHGPVTNIFIVTGKVQGGKTTFVEELVDALKKKGLSIAGFLSTGTFRDGKRDSFTLKDLTSGMEIPLAASDFREGWIRYSRFYFNPSALERGTEMVQAGLKNHPDLIVIDEVGPMELEGKGWNGLLRTLADVDTIPQVWIARDRVVDAVLQKWNISANHVITIDPQMENRIRRRLLGDLLENIVNFDPHHHCS